MDEITGGGLTSDGRDTWQPPPKAPPEVAAAAAAARAAARHTAVELFPILPPLWAWTASVVIDGRHHRVGQGLSIGKHRARARADEAGDRAPVIGEVSTAGAQAGPVRWGEGYIIWPGQSFLGVDEAGKQIVVDTYGPTVDGRTSVHHAWVSGRTGAVKESCAAALILPGLAAGTEIVLNLAGGGDSLYRFTGYVTTAGVMPAGGSPGRRFEQLITLAWSVLKSRQQRGWTGPDPADPVLTLVISDSVVVKDHIAPRFADHVLEIARLGERLGVRVIQESFTPSPDDFIGGSSFQAHCRLAAAFATGDPRHGQVVAQRTGEEIPLTGLGPGQAVVIQDGQVRARRASMGLIREDDIEQHLGQATPARLHPEDEESTRPLLELISGWAEEDTR
jgi:hypothetical protein